MNRRQRAMQSDQLFQQARQAAASGQIPIALQALDKAVQLDPGNAAAWTQLLKLLRANGAAANALKALTHIPASALATSDPLKLECGLICLVAEEYKDAARYLSQVARGMGATNAGVLSNLGTAYNRLADYPRAIDAYGKAAKLDPGNASIAANLAGAWANSGQNERAAELYGESLTRFPDDALLHTEYACVLLKLGRYAEGFPHYAWRWQSPAAAQYYPPLTIPRWDGQAAGRILLFAEQGLGDQILQSSLLTDLEEYAQQLTFACDPRLHPLLARRFPQIQLTTLANLDDPSFGNTFDFQLPIIDLGATRRVDKADFAHTRAWLVADSERVESLQADYEARHPGSNRIGISWRSKSAIYGKQRSTTLRDWLPVLSQPKSCFFSLQYGEIGEELASLQRNDIELVQDERIDPLTNIDALAAQIMALDLVITVDNTTAHLAGALGKETWVVLPKGSGEVWYWGSQPASCDWYTATRLFRSPQTGSWESVMRDITLALNERDASAVRP